MADLKIQQFNGGMGQDPRNQNFAYSQYIKNFNIFDNPYRLTPQFTVNAVTGTDTNDHDIKNFFVSSNGKLIGLGVVTADSDLSPTVFNKTPITNTSAWNTYGSAASIYGLRTYECWLEYKDYAYGWTTAGIFRFGTLSSTLTMTEEWQTLANTDAAQGLVHSQDDILYLPYANASGNWIIATYDGTDFTASAFALPTNLKVVRIVEHGSYLAIVCSPKVVGETGSRILIWDRDSSATTLTSNYNLGDVVAKTAGNIDGKLLIVSVEKLAEAGTKLFFHTYAGGFPTLERTVDIDTGLTAIRGGQSFGSKFYFAVDDNLSTTGRYAGVWCFGRESVTEPYAISIDRDVSTTSITAERVYAFLIYKDLCISSMSIDSPQVITTSINATSGGGTATYETQILIGDDSTTDKILRGISTSTVYLPSAGTIVAKYKKDAETSFTQIFTDGTNNLIKRDATQVEGVGNLPGFNEIQFQLISTGGAEITSLKAKYDVLPESYE